jgi:8-oxo-dGTP diphosphatase
MNPHYCLGFLFSKSRNKVMLIKKKKPEWQAGKLNGVGGKLEKNEMPHDAMVREFYEETGIWVRDWNPVASLQFNYGSDAYTTVHLFTAVGDWLTMVPRRDLPERANWYFWNDYITLPTIPNLKWLVPLCRNVLTGHAEILRLVTPL